MRIQHNIMAMTSYRNYNSNVSGLSTNLEKLSSGYRINRAGDDAAGLAISEKMRAQITGLDAAQKNVKDGISLVKTAEGALQEVQDMLHRGIYLSTQSANGTYDNEVDRANLQKEMDALKSEIDRIVDASNFNGKQLLDGSLGAVATITETPGVDAGAGQAAVKASFKIAFNPATAVGDTQRVDVGSLNATAGGPSILSAQISAIIAQNRPTTIGGVDYTIAYDIDNSELTFTQTSDPTTDGVSVDTLKTLAESVIKIAGTSVAGVTVSDVVQGKAAVAPNPPASGAVVELDYTDRTGSEVHGTTVTIGDKTYEFVDTGAEATGTNLAVEVAADADDADIALALRNKVREDTTLYDAGGTVETKYSVEATDAKLTITSIKKGADAVAAEVKQTGGGMTLQIGETGEVFNRLTVFIDDMHTEALGLKDVNIGTLSDAQASVAKLRNAVNTVSATRGDLGAAQNRLEHTYSNLSVMEENITDAESTVRDTDVADEMMAYTKNNILIQSAQAMLAQANAVPQGVLQLLQ